MTSKVSRLLEFKKGGAQDSCVSKNAVILPLSAAQQGIWFAQKIDPQRSAYNIGEYIEIHGAIDATLFEPALRQIIAEGDTLHARFVELADEPHQTVVPSLDCTLLLVDLSTE